eukprot:m51a1_g6695 hypothetical protein (495) ;mRNA; f:80526-82848
MLSPTSAQAQAPASPVSAPTAPADSAPAPAPEATPLAQVEKQLNESFRKISVTASGVAGDVTAVAGSVEGAVSAAADGVKSAVGGFLAKVSAFVGIGPTPRAVVVGLNTPRVAAVADRLTKGKPQAEEPVPSSPQIEGRYVLGMEVVGRWFGEAARSWRADAADERTMGAVLVADAADRAKFPEARDELRELLAHLGGPFADRGALLVAVIDAGATKEAMSAEEVVAQLGLRTLVPKVNWHVQQTPSLTLREGWLKVRVYECEVVVDARSPGADDSSSSVSSLRKRWVTLIAKNATLVPHYILSVSTSRSSKVPLDSWEVKDVLRVSSTEDVRRGKSKPALRLYTADVSVMLVAKNEADRDAWAAQLERCRASVRAAATSSLRCSNVRQFGDAPADQLRVSKLARSFSLFRMAQNADESEDAANAQGACAESCTDVACEAEFENDVKKRMAPGFRVDVPLRKRMAHAAACESSEMGQGCTGDLPASFSSFSSVP